MKPKAGDLVRPKGDLLQSVQRACTVLHLLAKERRPLTAREISSAIGINVTTCYHLLNTLEHEGFLWRHERHFWLGHRLGELHDAFEEMLAPDPKLVAVLRELNLETRETSYLGVWSGDEVVSVGVLEGRGGVRVPGLYLGYRQHAYARALGRALLAHRDDGFIDRYLETTPLEQLTEKTITDRESLRRVLADIRTLGVAVEREEFTVGVCCAAAPVFNASSQAVAALSVSVPKARFDSDGQSIVEIVRRCAELGTDKLVGTGGVRAEREETA